MKRFNLGFGILIEDSTDLSCGIEILNQTTKFVSISYSSIDGFYCTTIGKVISLNDISVLEIELSIIKSIFNELQDLGYNVH